MKKFNLISLLTCLLVATGIAQDNQWAVYAVITQGDQDQPDPCDIRYVVLLEDSAQRDLLTAHFRPIYQDLNQVTAHRLRDLHSARGSNLPDNVVKFQACTLVESAKPAGRQGILRKGLALAKKEFERKGILYFVGQGAKALASSELIKDDKANEILKSVGRIKIKMPIKAKTKDRRVRARVKRQQAG